MPAMTSQSCGPRARPAKEKRVAFCFHAAISKQRAMSDTRRTEMFALVADIENYPEFLPLCTGLTVRSRKERDGRTLLVADMSVGYKAIRETFTTQVFLKPDERTSREIHRRSVQVPAEPLALRPGARWRLRGRFLHRLRIQEPHPRRADGYRCSTARSACFPTLSKSAPTRSTAIPAAAVSRQAPASDHLERRSARARRR